MPFSAIAMAERGFVPDALIRAGIRSLLAERLENERVDDDEACQERLTEIVAAMSSGPIAVQTAAANEQHYMVPPAFFERVLGPRLKYSCCLYHTGMESLGDAEDAMLDLTIERAELADGQDVLELGCGWGSLSLTMARRFPGSRITAVSNSADQRRFIEARAAAAGLDNLTVITCDMNEFQPDGDYDRIVSVEMFEHMRNWRELFSRVAAWLRDDGRFFMHIFTHRLCAYFFETEGEDNWLGRHFFTGGVMPADSLPLYFQNDLILDRMWAVNGRHYQFTAEAWLTNADRHREELLRILAAAGEAEPQMALRRWRIFFMACAELWGYRGGAEWHVAHYRFRRR